MTGEGIVPTAADAFAQVRIACLADHPAMCPVVASWLHREWLGAMGGSFQDALDLAGERLNTDHLPVALLALAGDVPVGTASVILDKLPAGPGRAAYLSGVYVLPHLRGRGIGTLLCHEARAVAVRLDKLPLHLLTPSHEAFYRRLGWSKLLGGRLQSGDVSLDVAFMSWR